MGIVLETITLKKRFPFLFSKRFLITLGLLILVFVLLPLLAGINQDIIFNQHFVEKIRTDYGSPTLGERMNAAFSAYMLRWNNLITTPEPILEKNDSKSVFAYVFSRTPYYAIVYPTETYYYYRLPQYNISGNFRFVDIDRGLLDMGYFTEGWGSEDGGSASLGSADGVYVHKISSNLYRVSYQGKSVIFKLPSISSQQPATLKLYDNEEFIATVQDEGGLLFVLIYNNQTKSFYYLLNEDLPLNDHFTVLQDNVYLGDRTEYVYYQDELHNRKLLIGISAYNVMQNNYYDGPFDQVPPTLPIRNKLYAAYPYTQYMQGLDAYGNFLDFEGSRVAISSYVQYFSLDEIPVLITNCTGQADPSVFWSCLTYEEKKDFHKTQPELFEADGTPKYFWGERD